MDNWKVCFIICYNDLLFLEECCYYIRALHVPENMKIEILAIEGASSMAEGYQSGMESSEAAYKVYLHQDVFLLNYYFIDDMLDIFSEQDIGMIGMVGSTELPLDAVMWHNEMRCGMIRRNTVVRDFIFKLPVPIEEKYREVQAVDGLLMATSVDIPWRKEVFSGWHFYDVSQSVEMYKHGYRVVVPRQENPWCLHDVDLGTGESRGEDYGYWQKRFLETYDLKEIFSH